MGLLMSLTRRVQAAAGVLTGRASYRDLLPGMTIVRQAARLVETDGTWETYHWRGMQWVIPAGQQAWLFQFLGEVWIVQTYTRLGIMPRPGWLVIDAGANVGAYSMYASRLVGPSGTVVAVEPAPKTFEALIRTIEANGASNVIPVQAALADREGTGHLRLSEHGMGDNALVNDERIGPTVEVPVTTIDRLVAEHHRPDRHAGILIKMDVEGAELLAIRGATETLKRWRPVLALAVYHEGERHREAVEDWVKSCNGDYTVKTLFGICFAT